MFNLNCTIMKVLVIILSMLTAGIINAETSGEKSTSQCYLEYEKLITNFNVSVDLLQVPYSTSKSACMQKVYSKGDYSLWKVPANEIVAYPNKNITGVSFNYFVYKSDNFHLTVNELNKSDVYKFFTE